MNLALIFVTGFIILAAVVIVGHMLDTYNRITQALGLPDTASADQIIERIDQLQDYRAWTDERLDDFLKYIRENP